MNRYLQSIEEVADELILVKDEFLKAYGKSPRDVVWKLNCRLFMLQMLRTCLLHPDKVPPTAADSYRERLSAPV